MTLLYVILAIGVWIALGVLGSAIAARYFWDEYGGVLGRRRSDCRLFYALAVLGGVGGLISVLTCFGIQKPDFRWYPIPPRDPRFRRQWEEDD